ncbi:MAG TPA: SRPBCC family protein [Gaiellaceae bacterium]|jgi:uncharacterized membrane protein
MDTRSGTATVKENAAAIADLAGQLASDKKFRKRLLEASAHGVRAKRRVWRQLGVVSLTRRLASDTRLRGELVLMTRDLHAAWRQIERKRRHRLRNTLLVLGGAGGAAAAATPQVRHWVGDRLHLTRPTTIQESIEVGVPVATAYNQWTQFEQFPEFMDGVEEVRQLDETRLHWVANVAGKRAEWDAKILEQHPDRQISWISEDGKKTRGTVTFEPRSDSRTLITLSMSYQARGLSEAMGSAAGIDARRVRGDLERFKDLIEGLGQESGGWRGEIADGETTGTPRKSRQTG